MFPNWVENLAKGVTNFTSGLFGSSQQSYVEPFYQVTRDDTDMNSVAGSLGVPLNGLVEGNGGMKTLPPPGTYISTGAGNPPPGTYAGNYPARPSSTGQAGGAGPSGYTPGRVEPGGSLYTPGRSSPTSGTGYDRDSPTTYAGELIADATQVAAQFSAFNRAMDISGTPNPDLLPETVSGATAQTLFAADAAAQGLSTYALMSNYGYVYKNGSYVQTGSLGAAGDAYVPGPGEVGYNPSGRGGGWRIVGYDSRGRAKWSRPWKPYKRKKKDWEAMAAKIGGANAPGTESGVLGLRLGSG